MKPIRLTEHFTTTDVTEQEQDDFFALLMEGYADRGGNIVVPRQVIDYRKFDKQEVIDKIIAGRGH